MVGLLPEITLWDFAVKSITNYGNLPTKPTHPPSPLLLEKREGGAEESGKFHNANLMEESSKSPSLPSKRGNG
jgi:hypothetical protein